MEHKTRQYWLEMVTGYFDAVVREDRAGVLDRFTEDAVINIINGDNPLEVFHKRAGAGERPFDEFYGHLHANYTARFDDMECIVDVEGGTAAAIFKPLLTPKPGSAYAADGEQRLRNCNFFWFQDGRIARMTIYYARPGAAVEGEARRPTPFPQARA
jgi:ketosteroid isomerase-like protein